MRRSTSWRLRRHSWSARRTSAAAVLCTVSLAAIGLSAAPATASPLFFFSTGTVTNQVATASRPGPASGPNQETETGDDFILPSATRITGASFTGLLPADTPLGDVTSVVAEIYRVFPADSDVGRTSGPPIFSTPQVPTRVNSPSDVALDSRDSSGSLSFSTTLLNSSFTAQNSVDTGIHPQPNQTTTGEGPVTGEEVRFDLTFNTPFELAAGHYFFVPQVELNDPDQHFLWLSASRPIDAAGTPFTPDLQSWVRNEALQPDWLRVGTDVIGSGTFNAAFTLTGTVSAVPLPGTLSLAGVGLLILGLLGRGLGCRAAAGSSKDYRP
jgi:hypothetical protein